MALGLPRTRPAGGARPLQCVQGRRRVGGRELPNCVSARPIGPAAGNRPGRQRDRWWRLVRGPVDSRPGAFGRRPRATGHSLADAPPVPGNMCWIASVGILLLGQRLLAGDYACADAWNFGPDGEGNRTVEQVLGDLARTWPQLRWQVTSSPQPHEAGLLQLDSAKAKMHLGWRPVWNLEKAIHHTANWYRRFLEVGEVSSADQLAAYVADAADSEPGLGDRMKILDTPVTRSQDRAVRAASRCPRRISSASSARRNFSPCWAAVRSSRSTIPEPAAPGPCVACISSTRRMRR